MPESLIRMKIKEALVATGNDRRDSLKLLMTWAIRDHSLLLAMTKPHLKGIVAALIDHHVRNAAEGKAVDDGEDSLSRSTIDDIVSSPRMDRRGSASVPPPKSTERQASAMRRLAAAFTKKKK